MTNARNRRRRQGRRPAFRDPKPTILVVSEGKVTEPEYLSRIAERLSQSEGHDRSGARTRWSQDSCGTSQSDIRNEARSKGGPGRGRESRLRFGLVRFRSRRPSSLWRSPEMARDNGILLAISNPCIEFWLLLHFRDNPGRNCEPR